MLHHSLLATIKIENFFRLENYDKYEMLLQSNAIKMVIISVCNASCCLLVLVLMSVSYF